MRERFRRTIDRHRDLTRLSLTNQSWRVGQIEQELKDRFLLGSDEIDRVIATMEKRDPKWASEITAGADAILRGDLFILGAGTRNVQKPIRWSRDYRSGLDFEADRYCFDIDLLDLGRPSDVRVVWELNRLHHLTILGKAYRLTGNPTYFEEFRLQVRSWMSANPVGRGVNWSCSMEVAIRAINMIWALAFMLRSPELDDDFLTEILQSLVAHGRFIRRNLEYSDIRNNHYLSDLLGLLVLGVFLPEIPESSDWIAFAKSELEKEIEIQVHSDGVGYEGSIPYQQLVVEIYLIASALLERRAQPISGTATERIGSMLEFVAAYTKDSGVAPNIGDGDDGRIVVLGSQRRLDHRHLLSTGALLLNRRDLASAAGTLWEETLWLLGPGAESSFAALHGPPCEAGSRAFSLGGIYVMRGNGMHLVVDCGDVGMNGRGGHGHHDMLSFELSDEGHELVIDTGSSSYTGDADERKRTLSVSAHNSPVVDGNEIGNIDDWGFIQAGAVPTRVVTWTSEDFFDELVAEHEGYHGLMPPVTVRRRFKLDRSRNELVIDDRFLGTGSRTIETAFHLHPDVMVEDRADTMRLSRAGVSWSLRATGPGQWTVTRSRTYPSYGVAASSQRLSYGCTTELPSTFSFSFSREPS